MHLMESLPGKVLPFALFCAWAAVYGSQSAPDGPAPEGPEFQISTDQVHAKSRVALAAHPDGRMVAVWSSNGQDGANLGIFAQRYHADGSAAGGEFPVNVETFQNQAHPAVGMDSSGNFVIAWQSTGNTPQGVYARRYAANGAAQGSEFQVASISGPVRPLSVGVAPGGDFVVVWETIINVGAWRYYGRRFDADGAPVGGEFQINDIHSPQSEAAAVAFLPDGGFLIAWPQNASNAGDIHARRYNAEGQTVGPEYAISEAYDAIQGGPVLAFNNMGTGILLWHRRADSGLAFRSIHARRLDALGQPVGAQFRVNQFNERSQEEPAVAMDSRGNVLAAWSSDRQDGTASWNIYARYLPNNGTRCLAEFRVNTIIQGHQIHPAVALAGDGRALIAWQNNIPSPTPERISGQRYNPPQVMFRDRFETCTEND